jgi:type I restriction enzyme S subunit
MLRFVHGSTMKHIVKNDFDNTKIPLPKLQEQQRIATILDHADSIRRKNRQILEKYNELEKSVFYEIFGDPEKNQFGFEIGTIRDLVSEVKYGTSNKSSDKGSYPYLRMNNLTYDGNMDYTDMKYVDIQEDERVKYTVRNGDILFNRTNSKELVGKTAVYKSNTEMVIAGYLIRVRVNQKASPEYISAYLNSKHGKATLFGMCKSIIGMANINAQEMQNIKILMPPINLQIRFAQIIERIANQKVLAQKSLEKSEDLFQCLLQRAFKGEL